MFQKNTYLPYLCTSCVVVVLLSCCILSSCKHDVKVQNVHIMRADSLIESRPDSTMAILASISDDSLPENDKIYRYLLQEYASLKLWQPVSPDSIMPMVVDYYQRTKDKKHLCKALYVQGAEYEHTMHYQKAMLCLKEAEQYIPYTDSTESLAGLIYMIEGAIFENNILYFLAAEKYKQALPFFLRNNDYIRISSCYRGLYDMDVYQDITPNAQYIDEAIRYAALSGDTLACTLTMLSKEQNATSFDSLKVLDLTLQLCDSFGYARYADYATEYYMNRQDFSTANYYLQHFATDTTTADWSIYQYHYLHSKWLYSQNLPQLAYSEILHTYEAFHEQIKQSNKVRTYLISRQYDLEKEQQKTLRLTITRQRLWISIGSIVFGFCIILLIISLIYLHKRMLHQQREQQLQADIRQLRTELTEKRNTLRQLLYQRLNITKHLHSGNMPDKLPRELRDFLEDMLFTDESNWQKFRTEFNNLYDNLLYKLKAAHPELTTQDEQVVALGVLQFDNSDIAFLLGITDRTIWNRRQKLKNRLGDPQMDLDQWFNTQANTFPDISTLRR